VATSPFLSTWERKPSSESKDSQKKQRWLCGLIRKKNSVKFWEFSQQKSKSGLRQNQSRKFDICQRTKQRIFLRLSALLSKSSPPPFPTS
jgi:hypothetical protein